MVIGDEHVLRLQVAVDDAVRVEVRQPRRDVACGVEDVLVGQRSACVAVNDHSQVARHQLGDDVEAGLRGLADAVDDEHVLVRKFRHDHEFFGQVDPDAGVEARI